MDDSSLPTLQNFISGKAPQQISTSLATVLYRAIRSVASKQDRQKTLNKQKGPYYKCFFFDQAKGR